MKLVEFISFLDKKKIEAGKICFKVLLPLNMGGNFWFYCEPGKSYADFINGDLLGKDGCLYDVEMPEDCFGNLEFMTSVHSYNDDGTPDVIVFEINAVVG